MSARAERSKLWSGGKQLAETISLDGSTYLLALDNIHRSDDCPILAQGDDCFVYTDPLKADIIVTVVRTEALPSTG